MRGLNNAHIAIYDSDNLYGFPEMPKCDKVLVRDWQTFKYAITTHGDRKNKGLMFYTDDYQFLRLWNNPQKYLPLIQGFGQVLSPDFSLYTDMPIVMQMFNKYRNHWLARYWSENGVSVIPSMMWSDESSYEWCFEGISKKSIVAVCNIGVGKINEYKKLFYKGYEEMHKRLEPSKVLFFTRQKGLKIDGAEMVEMKLKYRG